MSKRTILLAVAVLIALIGTVFSAYKDAKTDNESDIADNDKEPANDSLNTNKPVNDEPAGTTKV